MPSQRFLLVQKITPLINRYEFFRYANGAKGESVAFVEQKRFKLREEITAWTGATKTDVLFTLKAEKVMDAHGRFAVTDREGKTLGYLRKVFGKSLLRSTWEVHDSKDELLFNMVERNLPLALLRRFGGFIPIVGEVFELIPFNFDFIKEDKKVGYFSRIMAFRDTYDLELSEEAGEVDYRVVLALGVALDALQSR